jgi:5'-phosphate synthase pdxT subunit
MTRIGVLALQGAFAEHVEILSRLGAQTIEVRLPEHLSGLDGLIIPGGESTTISQLMTEYELLSPMREMTSKGLPVWGTCAGMIMLAQRGTDLIFPTLAVMDVTIERNAFGRQVDSFETELDVPALGQTPFPAVFIRAPVIVETGPKVQTLACLNGGTVVAAQQGHLLATAFHPELTDDLRFHRHFLEVVVDGKAAIGNPR